MTDRVPGTRFVEDSLRASGVLSERSTVVALDVVPLGGEGLVGEVRRLRPVYAGEPGPATLIHKAPAARVAEGARMAAAERDFYRAGIAGGAGVSVPVAHHVGDDGQLLLSDLGDGGFVPQVVGHRPEQAARALREVATLHRAFRGRAPVAETPVDSPVAAFCRGVLRTRGGGWPSVLGDRAALLVEHLDLIAALLATPDATLAHGDFHSQNTHLGRTACTLIDFQFVQHASGMLDVARFLGTSLTTDTRRAVERDLLAEYAAAAGAPVDTTALRAGLLWNLTTPLALRLVSLRADGGTWPARLPILERCLTAARDWDAWALLA